MTTLCPRHKTECRVPCYYCGTKMCSYHPRNNDYEDDCGDFKCCDYEKSRNARVHFCKKCYDDACAGKNACGDMFILKHNDSSEKEIWCEMCLEEEYGRRWEERFEEQGRFHVWRKFAE